MSRFGKATLASQLAKAAAELDKDFGLRQSARYREDTIVNINGLKRREKRTRKIRLEPHQGKKGATIAKIIRHFKDTQKTNAAETPENIQSEKISL